MDAAPPRPDWLDRDLYPFRDRYVEVEGCRVHFIDEGSGPPLLFLHGNPTWSFLYRNVVSGLGDRFRCVALDYPGFGLSTAPDGYGFTPAEHARVVRGFVERLELSELTMMVHDWGGPIGLHVAAGDPARMRAVVIGNTWGWPLRGDRRVEMFSRIVGGPVGRFLVRRFNAFVSPGIPMNVKRRRLSGKEMAAYVGPFPTPPSREPVAVLPRELLASSGFLSEVEAGLDRLRHLPALIVWGNRDVAFKKPVLDRWERTFPRHRTVILHGAGHYIQEAAPDDIVAAIRRWWDEDVAPS